jgi:hypothetical protein
MNQSELKKLKQIVSDLEYSEVGDIGATAHALEGMRWLIEHNAKPRYLRHVRPLPKPRGRPPKKKK